MAKRGRKPGVNWYGSRNGYFGTLNGDLHRLGDGPDDRPSGPNYRRARDEWDRLVDLSVAGTQGQFTKLRTVLVLFLDHTKAHGARSTYATYKTHLGGILEEYGSFDMNMLRLHEIEAWIDRRMQGTSKAGQRKPWNASTAANAVTTLLAALNWAVRKKVISFNPLKGIERHQRRSRGREAYLTAEERKRIRDAAPADLLPLLVILEATGARPSEIAAATASAVDTVSGTITYHNAETRREGEHSHKTSKKGKTRTIFLSGEALSLVLHAAKDRPAGALFRTKKGAQWTVHNMAKRAKALGAKVGIPGFTLYSYRHTLATDFLVAGGNIDLLAALMGNTPNVIRRHYAHAMVKTKELRAAMESFLAARDSQSSATSSVRLFSADGPESAVG